MHKLAPFPRIWRSRFDYFLVWGHGLKHAHQVIELLATRRGFKILRVQYYRPRSLPRFVRAVYSYDYAPFQHLKTKTRYLLTTEPLVLFIFVENTSPGEIVVGDGVFRHVESSAIKTLKEEIRDRFNERCEDRRDENHVIHASDTEEQTDRILKHIGFTSGIEMFRRRPNPVLDVVYHLRPFEKFNVESVCVKKLFCRILHGTPDRYETLLVPVAETPHAAFLRGDADAYERYLSTFGGWLLTDHYSMLKFARVAETLDYHRLIAAGHYIITERINANCLAVQDGVHRSAILDYRMHASFPVAIIE